MSLQSERLLTHIQRLRLTHLPQCYSTIAEEASSKNLPYLDFLERLLESESQAKYDRNVKLKTQWAHFPYLKRLDQFDFSFQPAIHRAEGESGAARSAGRGQDASGHCVGGRSDPARCERVLHHHAGSDRP